MFVGRREGQKVWRRKSLELYYSHIGLTDKVSSPKLSLIVRLWATSSSVIGQLAKA
jgi:hypothetical protein